MAELLLALHVAARFVECDHLQCAAQAGIPRALCRVKSVWTTRPSRHQNLPQRASTLRSVSVLLRLRVVVPSGWVSRDAPLHWLPLVTRCNSLKPSFLAGDLDSPIGATSQNAGISEGSSVQGQDGSAGRGRGRGGQKVSKHPWCLVASTLSRYIWHLMSQAAVSYIL